MSDDLYSTRLRWGSRGGIAKLHGVQVDLGSAPVLLGGVPVVEMDYTPEVRCWEIRRVPGGRMEEMNGEEIRAADELLRVLTGEEGDS